LAFVLDEATYKPDNAQNVNGRGYGLFVQDTVTIANRLTIIAGMRWDRAYNWNPAQNRLDGPWCGLSPALANPAEFCGATFPQQDISVTWNNMTPRIGLVYDITGDGTWAAKFNYSRYAEALGVSYAFSTNVNGNGSEDWNWFDPNGDNVFQYGEQTTFRSRSFPGLGTEVDSELEAPISHEFTGGIDHEIADNMLLSVTGIVRGRSNDVGTVNIGRPFGPMFDNERCQRECTPFLPFGQDPWVELSVTDPGADGIFGTADDGGPVPIWALT
jgi:hypothetical protein